MDQHGEWEDLNNWIFRNKLTYMPHRDLYVRTIISGYLDDYHLDDSYDLSMLIEYTYLPGSKIFLVYENTWLAYDYRNDVILGFDELETQRQTLYVKISYLLDL